MRCEAYFDGRDFIFGNGGEAEADRIIFRARMAAASLSLLLGLLVFLAAREMFGDGSALFALALVVFHNDLVRPRPQVGGRSRRGSGHAFNGGVSIFVTILCKG